MSIQMYLFIPVTAVLVVSIIMARFFRSVEKRDKGFAFFYHKLTYRRRMKRNLWNIPIMLSLYFVIYWIGDLESLEYIAIGVILLFAFLIELTWNYVKWRKIEREV